MNCLGMAVDVSHLSDGDFMMEHPYRKNPLWLPILIAVRFAAIPGICRMTC